MTPPGGAPVLLVDRSGRETRIWDEKAKAYRTESLYRLPSSAMQGLKQNGGAFDSVLRFRNYLERFQAFLLWNPQDLKKPWQGLAERLGPSGERLPGFWAHLRRKEPAKADELLMMLQRIFPKVDAILSTGKQSWGWHHLTIREEIGDKTIEYPAEQASDGFLRMLAVFSLKYLPNPPRTITLEEPENGVHPHLISQIVGHLRALADRREPNKTQVFMTSHSPYVLNEFIDRPECVHIFEKPKTASVPHVFPLKERAHVLKAGEAREHSLGELWYSGILGGGAR